VSVSVVIINSPCSFFDVKSYFPLVVINRSRTESPIVCVSRSTLMIIGLVDRLFK
jgi:hypothetical protein